MCTSRQRLADQHWYLWRLKCSWLKRHSVTSFLRCMSCILIVKQSLQYSKSTPHRECRRWWFYIQQLARLLGASTVKVSRTINQYGMMNTKSSVTLIISPDIGAASGEKFERFRNLNKERSIKAISSNT